MFFIFSDSPGGASKRRTTILDRQCTTCRVRQRLVFESSKLLGEGGGKSFKRKSLILADFLTN